MTYTFPASPPSSKFQRVQVLQHLSFVEDLVERTSILHQSSPCLESQHLISLCDFFTQTLLKPHEKRLSAGPKTRIEVIIQILIGWASAGSCEPLEVFTNEGLSSIDCGNTTRMAWTEYAARILVRDMKGNWTVGKPFHDNDAC
jgi:hypothetical protein